MKDFVGVNGVITPQRLAELSQRKDGPALLYLASHWGAIGLTGWLMYLTSGTWWCVPLFMLQGVLLNYLYAPVHECDHHTAFKTNWLNVWVARASGFLNFNPSEHHRWSHYTHHRNTQNWEKDTELERPPFKSVSDFAVYMSGFTLIKYKLFGIAQHAFLGSDEWYMTPTQRAKVVNAARWHVAGYVLMAASAAVFQSWWVLYYWWGPFVLMRWTYMLQGGAEHTFLTHEPNTLLNTRTFRTNAFMRWVNWNMTYHTVHHTFPSVPFFRLPELHREVEKVLGYELPGGSYLALHWSLFKHLGTGKTELDLCDENTAALVADGKLQSTAPQAASA
jgi:fatty acid desaturase